MNSIKTLLDSITASLLKIKSLAGKTLTELWLSYRKELILFGALILTIKMRDILISLLINSGKGLFQNTQNKSDKLQTIENKDNNAANTLIQEAQQLPNDEKPINTDWNKNE